MVKKKTRELTRLLNKKLESLGVSSETKLKETGKKRGLSFEDGKLVGKNFPVYTLQNLKKQMIKKILEGGEYAARAFIATDNKALQGTSANDSEASPTESTSTDV